MTRKPSDPAAFPNVSTPHCLRARFSGSSCSLCRDACPQGLPGLPELDGVISIDATACKGCLLCAAACPVGAIEPKVTEGAMMAALCRPDPIVLSCHATNDECHLRTPCLGFLAEDFLLALHSAATPRISLNVIHCAQCVNGHIVRKLRERILALETRTGLPISEKVKLIDRAADLGFEPETIGRRGFFTSLTRSLLREAAGVLATPATAEDKPASYADKYLPLRQVMLNRGLDRLSQEEQQRITALMRWEMLSNDACDGCRACTKVCPAGALIENVDDGVPFSFDAASCTGCGLCVEFCLNGALSLHSTDLEAMALSAG